MKFLTFSVLIASIRALISSLFSLPAFTAMTLTYGEEEPLTFVQHAGTVPEPVASSSNEVV